MTLALLAAAATMTALAGTVLLVAGLRRSPAPPPAPSTPLRQRLQARRGDPALLAGIGLLVGLLLFAATGWFAMLLAAPAAAVGVPFLLGRKHSGGTEKLDAMAEWVRSLSGVLTVGVGLEQAIIATGRSAPAAIKPQVDTLIARLRARWTPEEALRAFADDLDDPTGDLIAAALILGARRRGAGLAAVLDGLAESVTAEVRVRRQIEADRAKPRTTARWITIITLTVLGLLMLNADYLQPYSSGVGQIVLMVLLAAYGGALLWLRKVALGSQPPRFLGEAAAQTREAAA